MAVTEHLLMVEASRKKSIWDKLLCSDIFGSDSMRTEMAEGMESTSKIKERIDVLTHKLGLLTSKLTSINILTNDRILEEEYERIKSNRLIVNGRKRNFKASHAGREPTEEELKDSIKKYLVERMRSKLNSVELTDLSKTKNILEDQQRRITSRIRDIEALYEIQDHIRASEATRVENNFKIAQSRILLFLYGFRKEILEVLSTKRDLSENDKIVLEILEETSYEAIKEQFTMRINVKTIKLFTYNLCDILKATPLTDMDVNVRYSGLEHSLRGKGVLLMGGNINIFNLYYDQSY